MKEIRMNLLNNGGNRTLPGYLSWWQVVSSTTKWLNHIGLLTKGTLWKVSKQTNLLCGLLLAPLKLMTRSEGNNYTTHWTWRAQTSANIEPSSLLSPVQGTGTYSAWHQRRKENTNQLQSLWSVMTYCKMCHCNSKTKFLGVTNYSLIRFKRHSMRWNSCHTLLSRPGT